MKLGTQKIEAIVDSLGELAKVAKRISADKKVDLTDLQHVIGLLPLMPGFIEDFKSFGEAFEEGKDIDVAEVVSLIQKVHSKFKEIEAA